MLDGLKQQGEERACCKHRGGDVQPLPRRCSEANNPLPPAFHHCPTSGGQAQDVTQRLSATEDPHPAAMLAPQNEPRSEMQITAGRGKMS